MYQRSDRSFNCLVRFLNDSHGREAAGVLVACSLSVLKITSSSPGVMANTNLAHTLESTFPSANNRLPQPTVKETHAAPPSVQALVVREKHLTRRTPHMIYDQKDQTYET